MFTNIVTFAVLASALVGVAPVVGPLEIDNRVFSPLSENNIEVDTQNLATRSATILPGFANFERLSPSSTTEIGYYGGLYYRGFGAANSTLVGGLKPRTGRNFAVYGGAMTGLSNHHFITTRFPRSRSISFGVNSFFFGCAGSVPTISVGCKIALAGYNNLDQLVAYQTFYYDPTRQSPHALAPAVTRGTFASGLVTLRVATLYVTGEEKGSTVFDNIRYKVVQNTLNVTAPSLSSVSSSSPISSRLPITVSSTSEIASATIPETSSATASAADPEILSESISATATVSETPSESVSDTASESVSATASESISAAASESISATASESISAAASESGSTTASAAVSETPSESVSAAASESISTTASESISATASESISATGFESGSTTASAAVSETTSGSGSTTSTTATSAMTTTSSQPISVDGECGVTGNGYTCAGSVFGDCCSEYGYCGTGSIYCQAGCQPAYGMCTS